MKIEDGKTWRELDLQPGDMVRLVRGGANSDYEPVNDPKAIGFVGKGAVLVNGHGSFTPDYDARFVLVARGSAPDLPETAADAIRRLTEANAALAEELARVRGALTFYALPSTYAEGDIQRAPNDGPFFRPDPLIDGDRGATARAALSHTGMTGPRS